MRPLDEYAGEPGSASGWRRHRLTFRRILGMALVAGMLLLFTRVVTVLPCWGVFVLVGLITWPVWQYRTEYLLFRRRLVLAGAARPESRIRSFLWTGGVTRAVQAVVSMGLAWVLFVLVSRLPELHGYLLLADAIFLALLAGPVTRHLCTDIKGRHRGVIARRWPLFLINGVVLSAALMALDFFVVGAADTRQLVWHQVAERAFTEIHVGSRCVLWGVSAGGVAAVEALSWHLSALVIPDFPDPSARIIAWSLFLLRAVTVAWLYTALLLGVSVLLDRQARGREGRAAGSTFSRSFFLTIVILAIPFLYASVRLGNVELPVFEEGVRRVAAVINPCKPDETSRARLAMKLDAAVTGEREITLQKVDAGIAQGLDRIFADVETGVDDYLDWYFTVIGEYQRLASVFATDVTATMRGKLEEYLFTHTDFGARLEDLDGRIGDMSVGRFAGMLPALDAELEHAACDIGELDLTPLLELDRDNLRASTAVTGGVGAGIVASKALAKHTAAAVAGKVAAKKSFQAGAALATKTLAKKGTSAAVSAGLGTTLCAPAGPGAILCGVAAGLVTWLAVDKTLIEIDEALHREELRTAILEVLAGQRAELGVLLMQQHHDRVDRLAARVNAALQRTFIPYRDGLGP